jgi:hypothetical protein
MSMSHIYQPLMVMTLLEHQSRCDEKDIAAAISQARREPA